MGISRRDLLRWGIVIGGAAMLPGGLLPRLARADDLPPSPYTYPFLVELKPGQGIPPVAKKVTLFNTQMDPGICVNVDGTTAFHVSPPRVVPANTEFFLIHEKPLSHSFHPQLPNNILWGYDGMIPGPTIVSKSGTPQLVRFVNDLPVNDPVGIGEPISAIHRHGGFQAPEDEGYPLDTFCTGQSRDYFFRTGRPPASYRTNTRRTGTTTTPSTSQHRTSTEDFPASIPTRTASTPATKAAGFSFPPIFTMANRLDRSTSGWSSRIASSTERATSSTTHSTTTGSSATSSASMA